MTIMKIVLFIITIDTGVNHHDRDENKAIIAIVNRP